VFGLSFLHPWLAAGLLAASLPIIIHLIGKRRAPTVRFAAFDFLLAVNKRLARRERLRQILLLILRTAALVALALAVARPMPPRPAAAAASTASRHVALVLDTSASMSYQLGGKTLLALAKTKARDLLSHLSPGDMVTLVTAGPEVRSVLQAPTADLVRARAALDGVQAAGGVADLGSALEVALAQFGKEPGALTAFVVSDLAENSFRGLRPTSLDPSPEVHLVDAAERDEPVALGNVAIEAVTVESGGDAAAERRFRILVHNYGPKAVEGRGIELLLNGSVTQRGHIEVPPRSVQEKVFTYAFGEPGTYDGMVRLAADDADGYADDDQFLTRLEVAPGVRALVVDGDPSTTPQEDELFFAERALSALPRGDAPIDVRIVTRDELQSSSTDLEGFGVVVLANVDSLPEESVAKLAAFVRQGGGLLFALGDKIDFERMNASFGKLLPHPLRDLHLAADPAAGTPPLGISGIDWDHPIMQGLGSAVEESLRASRTSRYFNLDVGADRRTRAVLRFENGAPALIEARGGQSKSKGRVMLLVTSLDLDLTDLPLRSAFPALLQRTVRYLANTPLGSARPSLRQGGAADLSAPTGADAMALTSPAGTRRVEAAVGSRVHFAALNEVGFWRAEAEQAGAFVREPGADVAVNVSLDESDFVPVRPAAVAAALGEKSGRRIDVAFGTSGEGDPFAIRGYASLLLLAFCFFFIGESLLAARG
jgi:hypothetical protein